MDKDGSTVSLKLWNEGKPLDIQDAIKKSENLKDVYLDDFLGSLKDTIKQSQDINEWVKNLNDDDDLEV